jgi:hypothetical protein
LMVLLGVGKEDRFGNGGAMAEKVAHLQDF